MNQRNVFWGAILILIGALFLLRNIDVLDFNWWNFLRLWPFLLILLGIAVLPIRNALKLIFTAVTIILAISILAAFPEWNRGWHFSFDRHDFDDYTKVEEQYIFEEYPGDLSEAVINFDAAVGNFKLKESSDKLFEFYNKGNIGRYMYSVKEMDGKRDIDINMENARIRNVRGKNEVEIKINPDPVWDIKIDVGAADMELDLRNFMVRDLDIDGGASALELLIGDKYEKTTVNIDAGASSIVIRIPEAVACELNTETVLSSRNLDHFTKVSDGTFVTDNFSDSEKNIIINVDVAVSSLTVKRY